MTYKTELGAGGRMEKKQHVSVYKGCELGEAGVVSHLSKVWDIGVKTSLLF